MQLGVGREGWVAKWPWRDHLAATLDKGMQIRSIE